MKRGLAFCCTSSLSLIVFPALAQPTSQGSGEAPVPEAPAVAPSETPVETSREGSDPDQDVVTSEPASQPGAASLEVSGASEPASQPVAPPTPAPAAEPAPTQAQPTAPKQHVPFPMLTIALGIGSGVFVNAGDQNRAIENWQDEQEDDGTLITLSGDSEMWTHYLPAFNVTYAPIEYLRLRGIFEYGFSAKYVDIAGGEDRLFTFRRISAGGTLGFELPIRGERLVAFGLGAGPLFHAVKFEKHTGDTLGFKVHASAALRASDSIFGELFLAFDHVPAESDLLDGFELDYSSIQFGALVHYGLADR